MSEQTVRIQDDLFMAVNGEWLGTAVIPEDRPTIGGFADLEVDVEKTLMEDFAAFAEGKKTTDIPEMKYAVSLYKKILDVKRRTEEGITPVLPILEKIKNIKNVDELNAVTGELILEEFPLPVNMGVMPDMKDATKNQFIVAGPSIILPDTEYYKEDNEAGKQLLAVYTDMAEKVLKYTPLTEEEQKTFLQDTLSYDALIAKKVKSALEWSDLAACYNPMDTEEVAAMLTPFDIKKVLTCLYGDKAPERINVVDPRAIREMDGYFNEENFEMYVHWAYVNTLINATACLSPELKTLGNTYKRALSGIAADPELEKEAYQVASAMYSEPVGVYYGRTYFGEEAKKDVIDIVKKIIETYKLRIQRNTFLSEATKEQAIKKLSAMEIKMAYPDEIKPVWSKLTFDEEDSYFEAMRKILMARTKNELEKALKPVDRTEWSMPGHEVNACYRPLNNDLTFLAGILQKPFYSIDQGMSANLGGIGAVIGHEISHSFDTNGANFDELGNLRNWWQEEDFAAFKEKAADMTAQFDGIPFHGGKVSGELTVSENIADNGGMGVTLEIMHTLENADFREYFKSWGRIWCRKANEEYIQLLLASDKHSPNELRANMQPRNFPEWYEAFGVTEKDEMYIAPEKRISIW
ncbi:M13 family metallopeptidase [Butyrivibrio sp. DSM 10294]|uniref:M13-type metalloendopeptidase n=1 Tax=Butyrivibrio sp. DSM 10294 TaxID=2972457 RepID=UPI00234F8E64|nr:M13 family metallopeptidase [Butyrivibrio sp. DSM 10294]MDC7295043.1 M13 family metallopeptidase [Butyrivibrio sp. DSM 10294]